MKQLKFMEEQSNSVTDVAIAHDTRKKNAWQYEPSKTSFFRLDKNKGIPREYDKTNIVLPLLETENHRKEWKTVSL